MCAACFRGAEGFEIAAGVLHAKSLFEQLERAGRGGDLEASETAVREALAAGLRPSDVLVGVLHPVLGRIGQLWASGAITVGDEHRFTAFALQLIDHLRFDERPAGRPLVLLAVTAGGRHDVGVRMMQVLAWERGIACEIVPVGTSDDELTSIVAARRPELVGLSMNLVESLPVAIAFARSLARTLPAATELVLGGQALRRLDAADVAEGLDVVLTIDAFAERLDRLRERFEARASADPPGNDGPRVPE